MSNALIVDSVCKKYSDFEIKNVSFCVQKGKIVGLLGANGSGKSTIIKAILGLTQVQCGIIKILNDDISDKNVRKRMGVVFDGNHFQDGLTAKDVSNIYKRLNTNFSSEEFEKYISSFCLPKKKKIKYFSKGMRTKLAIAVSLACKPDLLIMDEATNGLDPVVRNEVLAILRAYVTEKNSALLISSHITSDIESIADDLVFLHDGTVVLHGSKQELLSDLFFSECEKGSLSDVERSKIFASYETNGVEYALVKGMVSDGRNTCRSASMDDIMVFCMRGVVNEGFAI